ncbi:MAG: sigma-70 family RNA polymerase sigma factor [Pirellulales bacterium]
MTNQQTSLSLLERLRQSSADDAWTVFFDQYGPMVRRWLIARGINQHDADDLQQQVMQFSVENVPHFEHFGIGGAFGGGLRRVVSFRLRSHWRAETRREAAAGGSDGLAIAQQLEDPESRMSKMWDDEFNRMICQKMLERVQTRFTEQSFRAFQLVVMDGRRAADVAKELGMSPGAVRTAQSRVLRELRDVMEQSILNPS